MHCVPRNAIDAGVIFCEDSPVVHLHVASLTTLTETLLKSSILVLLKGSNLNTFNRVISHVLKQSLVREDSYNSDQPDIHRASSHRILHRNSSSGAEWSVHPWCPHHRDWGSARDAYSVTVNMYTVNDTGFCTAPSTVIA